MEQVEVQENNRLIDAIRKRLADCPIPELAQADWRGTEHYEIKDPTGNFWWLDVLDLAEDSFGEEWDRLGAVLDYSCAYRRDVKALLVEIDSLREERDFTIAHLQHLRRDASAIVKAIDKEDCPLDAVNWSDLDCAESVQILADAGEVREEVLIEEAQPEAEHLRLLVREGLEKSGWENVSVRMEW